VVLGVHELRVGYGLEQPGHVREALALGLLGENEVTHVCLAFASEGVLQEALRHLPHSSTTCILVRVESLKVFLFA